MEFWVKAGQLLLSLSILVMLHELGHYLPAKWFKTRVEKFYLFFDFLFPFSNTFNFSLFKFKKDGTEFGIGWFPLGGYVKIAGMMDESQDKDSLSKPPEPWEFRSKPAWQRLIIMSGGVIVNIILGFAIYMMILFVWGEKILPAENVKNGVVVSYEFEELGLQDGDKIISFDGEPIKTLGESGIRVIVDKAKTIEFERAGEVKSVRLPSDLVSTLLNNETKSFFTPRFPFVIAKVGAGTPAEKAEMETGDKLLAINGVDYQYFDQFSKQLKSRKGETIQLKYLRGEAVINTELTLTEEGLLGVNADYLNGLELVDREYTFAEAIPAGIDKGVDKLSNYVKSLSLLFSKAGAKQLGGFGSIGNMFPPGLGLVSILGINSLYFFCIGCNELIAYTGS